MWGQTYSSVERESHLEEGIKYHYLQQIYIFWVLKRMPVRTCLYAWGPRGHWAVLRTLLYCSSAARAIFALFRLFSKIGGECQARQAGASDMRRKHDVKSPRTHKSLNPGKCRKVVVVVAQSLHSYSHDVVWALCAHFSALGFVLIVDN